MPFHRDIFGNTKLPEISRECEGRLNHHQHYVGACSHALVVCLSECQYYDDHDDDDDDLNTIVENTTLYWFCRSLM